MRKNVGKNNSDNLRKFILSQVNRYANYHNSRIFRSLIILNSYGGTRRPNVLTNLKLRIKTWPVSRMQKYVYINMLSKQTYCTLCTLYSVHQRVCTSREEMGGGCGFFTQIEPN